MQGDTQIGIPARLMAEPARAAMLTALVGGRSLPAGELATIARVSPSTASNHLSQLVAGGMLTVRTLGRHRYFELATAEIAAAIEALQAIAPREPVSGYTQSRTALRLGHARTCYDHIAGAVALQLADALVATGTIAPLVAASEGTLLDLSTPVAELLGLGTFEPRGRRPAVRGCLDWTERRPHLAGRLGRHLLAAFLDRGWATQTVGDRALRITDAGRSILDTLGSSGVSPSSPD
ncbi:winged helix-turn-helix domain-containing protein [Klugiella xanthotipulae]|uniref:ArsR family transcriptional regulator n=1 Tax=Klugiella xanthotipulae TaxID=244735 RepID=A0A543I5K9_9MICO|nr:helix-turn-helix domain-containing protein [Klugiella xanthotipulae]TQM65893.1 ArsR family transcriptional regulator [Klugiella xanthotipulae]